jgi:hypothetical protein
MSSILECDLKEFLAAQSSITALVPAAQIYPAFIRSDAVFPCLSLTTVGQVVERTLGMNKWAMKRIQIDCFAQTFLTCKQLEQAVSTALDGITGLLQSGSGIRVISCYLGACIDNWDSDSSIFRTMLTFEIEFSQGASGGVLAVAGTPYPTFGIDVNGVPI